MRSKIFVVAAILISAGSVRAQALKPGEWRTYTSMRSVRDVAVCCDSAYAWAATGGGAFRVFLANPTDSIVALRKTDGLSENDLLSVAADGNGNVYFGGRSGGFDIYHSATGKIDRLPDIRQSNHPAKSINAITVAGSKIYLATAYGITVFLPNSGVFGSTVTQIGSLSPEDSVRQVIDDGSYVYAAMVEGVAYCRSTADIQNRRNWSLIADTNGVISLASFRGTVYVGTGNGLFTVSADRQSLVASALQVSGPVTRIIATSDSLYVLAGSTLYSTHDGSAFTASDLDQAAGGHALAVAYAPFPHVIAGTATNGMMVGLGSNSHAGLQPEGPVGNVTDDLMFSTFTDELYVANAFAGISTFQPAESSWKEYPAGRDNTPGGDELRHILYDSVHHAAWVTSFGRGFWKVQGFDRNALSWEHYDTSRGIPRSVKDGYLVVGAPYLDQSGVVAIPTWALDGRGLSLSTDGENFTSYSLTSPDWRSWGCVTEDMSGNFWIGTEESASPKSIGVYWLRMSDKAYGTIPGGSGEPLIDPFVNSVLTDQDNGIWVGNELGVQIISNPDAIRNSSPQFAVRTVKFLTGQIVRTMTVDGVGNKWIGTDDGVFVVSPDGSDSVARYTTENSPLVDNAVKSIAIDPSRGEAYVGTAFGISRFATIFKRGHTDYVGINVFPNPVVQTQEQSPLIYVDGLVAGSTVQVFTLDGKLVTTINGATLGSTVTWNGRDALGRQVASGMYLISATSPQSGENGVAKVVIIRRP